MMRSYRVSCASSLLQRVDMNTHLIQQDLIQTRVLQMDASAINIDFDVKLNNARMCQCCDPSRTKWRRKLDQAISAYGQKCVFTRASPTYTMQLYSEQSV